MASLSPVRDLLLLREVREERLETQIGAILVPESSLARQRYRQWEVAERGPEVSDLALLPGARVIVRKFAGEPFPIDGIAHLIVPEGDVQAWVDE